MRNFGLPKIQMRKIPSNGNKFNLLINFPFPNLYEHVSFEQKANQFSLEFDRDNKLVENLKT